MEPNDDYPQRKWTRKDVLMVLYIWIYVMDLLAIPIILLLGLWDVLPRMTALTIIIVLVAVLLAMAVIWWWRALSDRSPYEKLLEEEKDGPESENET